MRQLPDGQKLPLSTFLAGEHEVTRHEQAKIKRALTVAAWLRERFRR